MHLGKTKVIFNHYADKNEIKVYNKELEIAEEYIYLENVIDQPLSLTTSNFSRT